MTWKQWAVILIALVVVFSSAYEGIQALLDGSAWVLCYAVAGVTWGIIGVKAVRE